MKPHNRYASFKTERQGYQKKDLPGIPRAQNLTNTIVKAANQ
jgi:hypothetical protein